MEIKSPVLIVLLELTSLFASQKGFTPLHVAAKYGSLDVAKLLLQQKALSDDAGKVSWTVGAA